MTHGVAAPNHRQIAQARRARVAFREFRGPTAEASRATEIATLPAVVWKGKHLRTIRCHGTTGKGPHDCNVPEGLLWALMSLDRFHCVYHPRDLRMTP